MQGESCWNGDVMWRVWLVLWLRLVVRMSDGGRCRCVEALLCWMTTTFCKQLQYERAGCYLIGYALRCLVLCCVFMSTVVMASTIGAWAGGMMMGEVFTTSSFGDRTFQRATSLLFRGTPIKGASVSIHYVIKLLSIKGSCPHAPFLKGTISVHDLMRSSEWRHWLGGLVGESRK